MANNSTNIFQFKISLKRIKPPIWRRIQVPANYNFKQLHFAIQDSFGWKSNFFDYHLHVFRMRKPSSSETIEIGTPVDTWGFNETIPEERVQLLDFFVAPKIKAIYEYDLGDSWVHEVILEKIMPAMEGSAYPKCVAGRRACPLEDGGVISDDDDDEEDDLENIENQRHPEYEERKTVSRDPEAFDPSEVLFYEGKMRQDNPDKIQ